MNQDEVLNRLDRLINITYLAREAPYKTGPRGGQWRSFRINQSFMRDLAETYGMGEFSTKEAYEVYMRSHLSPRMQMGVTSNSDPDLYWVLANIRQNLYAAAARGIVRILRPGIFRFEL